MALARAEVNRQSFQKHTLAMPFGLQTMACASIAVLVNRLWHGSQIQERSLRHWNRP